MSVEGSAVMDGVLLRGRSDAQNVSVRSIFGISLYLTFKTYLLLLKVLNVIVALL